uniref:Fanconi Anaemia group E protein C-terminal domain-containing protein n=1 Tax=Tetradesmus obliquus TaxID=3088 RepID=A0A383WC66_TETOB|eukprot:jgi/Sobl393_1/13028/SZX74296.1
MLQLAAWWQCILQVLSSKSTKEQQYADVRRWMLRLAAWCQHILQVLRLSNSNREQPGAGVEEQPGAGVGEQPGAGVEEQPGAGVEEQQPGAGVEEQQPGAAVEEQQPGAGVGEQPGAGVGEQPGAGVEEQPGAGVEEQQPGAAVEEQPGAAVGEQQPGTAVEEQQQVHARLGEQQPGAAVEEQPEDVVRLRASSLALQQLCSSRLSSALLVRSVAAAAQAAAAPAAAPAAAAPAAADKRNSIQALQWLLRQPSVTVAMVNHCSQQLLAIPGVPLAAAYALVWAGLHVQITGQQLLVRAFEGFEGLDVWVQALSNARVPLEGWAADLPAELRRVCCCDRLEGPINEHLLKGLTPARAADLIAVALNVVGSDHQGHAPGEHFMTFLNVSTLFRQPATAQLPAAAAEALLRLVMQLRHRNAYQSMSNDWLELISQFCKLPAAARLPTATVVELAQQAVQYMSQGPIKTDLAAPLLRLLGGRELTVAQSQALLSLLHGPSAAAAAAQVYRNTRLPGGRTVKAWLASQLKHSLRAARQITAAADARDDAAAAQLVGSQGKAGTAGGM